MGKKSAFAVKYFRHGFLQAMRVKLRLLLGVTRMEKEERDPPARTGTFYT